MRSLHATDDVQQAKALLEEALSGLPQRLDLAAMAICRLERPEADPSGVVAVLEGLAHRVRARLSPGAGPLEMAQALKVVLGDEEGFRGNPSLHGEAEQSFFDRVVAQKTGLPILLSSLYLEVARRAGIPLFGVSFPGHFLVALENGEDSLVLDPFNAGNILTEAGLEDLLKKVAPQLRFSKKLLTPAPVKQIAYRMLTNLKRLYLDKGDGERALRAVELLLVLSPDHPGELRARASILSALGAFRAALKDVERCLALSPGAPDHTELELTAQALRQRVEFLH